MPPSPRLTSLNIFAIRDNITDVFREDHDSHPIVLDEEQIGTLYVRPSNPGPPEWLREFFGPTVDVDSLPLLLNSTSAAVFLVTIATNRFAVAFGHGRYMLNPTAIEPRFGLRTAPERCRCRSNSVRRPKHTRRRRQPADVRLRG